MLKKLIFLSLILGFVAIFLKSGNAKDVYANCNLCPGPLCNVDLCPPLPTLPPIIPTCPVTPTPEPTSEPTPTPDPGNEPTPTPIINEPTVTPGPGEGGATVQGRPDHNTCYYQCNSDSDCHAGQDCQDVGGGRKICRNPNCTDETSCNCPGPSGAGGEVLGATTGQVLGLAATGNGQDLNSLSIFGRILIIVGALILL